MPPTICPNHDPATVLHDDAQVCPVCAELESAANKACYAASMLASLTAHVTAMWHMVGSISASADGETANTWRHPEPAPQAEVLAGVGGTPEPEAEDRETLRAECIKLEKRLHPIAIAGVRGSGFGPAPSKSVESWRGRQPAMLAYRDALRAAVDRSNTLDTDPHPEPSTQPEPARAPDAEPDEEPEPTEREMWTLERIRTLMGDPALDSYSAVVALYRRTLQLEPPLDMVEATMRAAIARREWSDAHPEDDLPW